MIPALLDQLPILAVMLPVLGACAAFFVGPRRAPVAGIVTALLVSANAVALTYRVLASGALRYRIGGWGAPLGIDLVADGTAALFVLLAGVVGLAVSVYAWSYFRPKDDGVDGPGHGLFWTLWLFLWAALNGLFLTGDVFNVYVCLEIVGISAVALVTLAEGPQTLRAGLRYLFASILGAMTYLLGVTLLYASAGVLDMASLPAALGPDRTAHVGLAFMVVALVLKTALFPAHFWLPSAHASAPTPVSALLSALVVKGSFFVMLRLFLDVMPPGYLGGADIALGVLGSVAIVWGSLLAMRQRRLKLLVAYSTVAQIGYLFLVFPLARAGGAVLATALTGTLVHAVSHGLAKAAMFLSAGGLLARYGHDRIDGLTGAARVAPVPTFAFALAGVTMMGLPPSGGFGAKWLTLSAALTSGQWWWGVVVVLGGLLAAVYVFGAIRPFMAPAEKPLPPSGPSSRRDWVALALAVLSSVLVLAVPLVTRLAALGTALAGSGGVAP